MGTARHILRWAGLVLASVLVFSLISTLAPFAGKSVLGWLSRTHSTIEILAYFGRFFVATIGLFVVPFFLLVVVFGACLFAASRLLKLNTTFAEVESATISAYLPFLLFFWLPVVSFVTLFAAGGLLIRKLGRKVSPKSSVSAYVLGLLLFLLISAVAFFTIYLSAGFELAGPVKEGDLYLIGYTSDGRCGVHGVAHSYAVTYDTSFEESLEIYQPASYYETLAMSEVALFSFVNLQVLSGRLLPQSRVTDTEIKRSFPPRMSDFDNPPVKLYYIGYVSGDEKCTILLPVWREQYFFYHHGDITPVVICTKRGEVTRLVISARSESLGALTLFRKGLSNVKQGLPGHKFVTPFVHGLRVFHSGNDGVVMKYTNPMEYVNAELRPPVKILVVTPWHVFKPYDGKAGAVRTKPELVPLTEETFSELKREYPALGMGYDVTDPFEEPYVYINYPSVEPRWPKKVSRAWVERNDCVFLSPLWDG